jgi:hypothetical protein
MLGHGPHHDRGGSPEAAGALSGSPAQVHPCRLRALAGTALHLAWPLQDHSDDQPSQPGLRLYRRGGQEGVLAGRAAGATYPCLREAWLPDTYFPRPDRHPLQEVPGSRTVAQRDPYEAAAAVRVPAAHGEHARRGYQGSSGLSPEPIAGRDRTGSCYVLGWQRARVDHRPRTRGRTRAQYAAYASVNTIARWRAGRTSGANPLHSRRQGRSGQREEGRRLACDQR